VRKEEMSIERHELPAFLDSLRSLRRRFSTRSYLDGRAAEFLQQQLAVRGFESQTGSMMNADEESWDGPALHLSRVLGADLVARGDDRLGKVDDVIVRLRGGDYPLVTGLVARLGGLQIFVPYERIAGLAADRLQISGTKVDLRAFERREGEVLLKTDILGHRLIDVTDAELVRAWDVELREAADGWVLSCLDTRRPARLFGLLRPTPGHACRDWRAFEPLLGHTPSALTRSPFRRLRRLKPAQIADLLEDATPKEGQEILHAVHDDPELEADVFEELEPDTANRFFADKTDAEVADVLAHMQADDAADAIADLPQSRRQPVLDLVPPGPRTKVITLLGFNETSAGGIMGVEFLAVPSDASAEEALRRVRLAVDVHPGALVTVHATDEEGRLVGTVTVIELLHAAGDAVVADIMEAEPVRVTAEADVVDVALLMGDYNLLTVPVVDETDRVIGVITVDDILEATIPDDWRRRERPAHPGPSGTDPISTSSEPQSSRER
jgi:CBS domain-containing protein